MYDHLGSVLFNQVNFEYEDKPAYFEQVIPSVEKLASWDSIQSCMNNPEFYDFELIDQYNQKIEIPVEKKAWINNKVVQQKHFLFDKVKNGATLICTNYGFQNEFVYELLHTFERIFDVHAAAHAYCGLESTKSFTIHDDYPANFIIQVEGTTKWKVFNNRISYLFETGRMNGQLHEDMLETAIDVEMKPGDMLYIPSRMYHCASPEDKRISVSIPCWNRLPSDQPGTEIDRNKYSIWS